MTNKEIVTKAMKEFFTDRDQTAIERYWHKDYVQHNPSMTDGHEGLKGLLAFIDPAFKWEPGILIESNDLVLAHSQVQGWGPAPLIVVDIFRLENGKIAEHWDVVQSEVPALKTASGNPMTSFNYSNPAHEQ
ncbi:Predicted SnoaL-like aldol condensation-catalyzing enzyme [Chitinophaga sp. YR627]|uniref:nuclear transport factor 2 family protein n=1 Tax=Chitinophaga sp. YR627 TaxID=1881041 RepID=UPI0008EFEB4F|nr:nuclear transport factor 2 family protein [Chitinophaga sp. YR627]SFM88853.1 Predicted SnoaL-like aldol condensation-catalyzing enzyme [Chitinophaga sp. YR627]